MNKYIYCECPLDYWPQIKSVSAKSYNDAVEKLIIKFGEELDDDYIINTVENFEQLRGHLNDNYSIALSDLEDIDEL